MPTAPDTNLTCLACLCKSMTERDNIRDGMYHISKIVLPNISVKY